MAMTPDEPRRHFAHWPRGMPHHLTLPDTSLWFNVEVSATRYPDKPFIHYYDTPLSYREFRDACERLAGHLQHVCGVRAGDRVLLYLQNSPQWIIGYYAILRADAVVVPVNPMNRADELEHYVDNAGSTVAITGQELVANLEPWHRNGRAACLRHVVVATYADHLRPDTDLRVPDIVREAPRPIDRDGFHRWRDALAAGMAPGPHMARSDDLAVMPYTSGTTGHPKGCMHTHRSVMATAVGRAHWFQSGPDSRVLAAMPLFHVTGMTGVMNSPIYLGGSIVVMTRWDRDVAAGLIQRLRINGWQAITTMVVDFLANPALDSYDLSSLKRIAGGGAAMPAAVAQKLQDTVGLPFIEGYGMSEAMGPTHINPDHRPKQQCLGIPIFDVDARVVDPATMQALPVGEVGEIVIDGPQVMRGYWRDPQADADAFVQIDGRRFLRTGDLGRIDEDGYFFMVDRLKRMINASGYKVWPAEVEALMYRHPAIQEVCIVSADDAKRGETVKAVVVLRQAFEGKVSEGEIIEWAHGHMAAYKAPRIVEFVAALPRSGSGKILWRELQAGRNARS